MQRFLLLLTPVVFLVCSPSLPIGGSCSSNNDCKEGTCLEGMCAGECDNKGEVCAGFGLCVKTSAAYQYCLPICDSNDDCDLGGCVLFYEKLYLGSSSAAIESRRCLTQHSDRVGATSRDFGCICWPSDLGAKAKGECSTNTDCGAGFFCSSGKVEDTNYKYCEPACPDSCKTDEHCRACASHQIKCTNGKCGGL